MSISNRDLFERARVFKFENDSSLLQFILETKKMDSVDDVDALAPTSRCLSSCSIDRINDFDYTFNQIYVYTVINFIRLHLIKFFRLHLTILRTMIHQRWAGLR